MSKKKSGKWIINSKLQYKNAVRRKIENLTLKWPNKLRRELVPALLTSARPRKKKHKKEQWIIPIGSPRLFTDYQMLPKIATKGCFPKRFPKATFRRLFLKDVIESCSPHNCAPQLLQKVVRKTVPESCFRNLFSKGPWSCARAALQSPKIGSQKCSQKISQSNSSKLLLKILQSKYSLKLFRKAVQSFPKAVPRSCSPKLFPKVVVQNCCPKAAILPRTAPQNHSAKRFPALRKCL